tara:strand:+ start:812 stop:2080 length:1269 start_codon:yes stop_codon:yes gene_type:complete
MSNRVSFDLISVPEEWSIIPCGVFFKQKSIKNTEGEMNLSVYRDYGVIPKDSRDDNHNRVSEDTSNYKLVEPGDFVLNKMKGWSGSLGVSEYRGIVSPSYTVLEPVREIHNKYFHYLLRSETYRQMYESLSYGVRIGQWELHYHDFKQIPSLYPPIDEQELISRYLDKKTEQVDSLIEKIQKKIELLKEKRTSLINHYVTKGLDPNVEMRESEIDWVGRIPTDWKCLPLKFISEINTGTTPKTSNTDFYNGGQHLWIKPGNLNEFCEILDTEQKLTPLGLEESRLLDKNSVLICGIGTIGKFGFSSQMVTTNQQIHGVCFDSTRLNPRYGLYLCSIMTEELIKNSEKVVISILNKGNLERLKIPVPSLSEQNQIVNFLETKVSSTTRRIELETQKADLLDEYLQSLISSVVTGKIRVTEDMI